MTMLIMMQVLYAREEGDLCGVVLAFKSKRFECIRNETVVYGDKICCDSILSSPGESERGREGSAVENDDVHQVTEEDGGIAAFLEKCRERREVALLTLLREKQSHRLLFVAVTHLFWNPEYPDVKMVQAATLCAESKRFLERNSNIKARNGAKDVRIPSILMGDFNSLPEYNRSDTSGGSASQRQQSSIGASGVYELLTGKNDLERHPHHPLNWRKSESRIATARSGYDDSNTSMYHKLLSCHGFHLTSGMKTCLGREPGATTCTPWFTGCLDYIFYTPKLLACEGYLEIPKDVLLTTNFGTNDITIDGDASTEKQYAMPNGVCPSDHLAVGCCFRFLAQ